MKLLSLLAPLAGLVLAACVTVDAQTNEPIPREGQRYPFEKVQELAEDLERGMPKLEVLFLLGSPAEESERGDQWIYLPERTGIIIPARALKLEFEDGRLETWAYHAIVLGQRL
ncbi:MAG: outer membrane protein assembly factor BamE [Planctomycetota bacterium]